MNRKVTEIKRHLNKPTERYECDLLESAAGHVKIRYVSDRTFASTRLGVTFPPGCITVGLYWETRPYVFWGIFTPEKQLLGYLVPASVLENRTFRQISGLMPVALLAALVSVQTFASGMALALDARAVALGAAIVALLLRAPFLVVVIVAGVTAGGLRALGWAA